jgi:hypothetical protein
VVEVHLVKVGALDERGDFGLGAVAAVAKLHVGAEAADLEVNRHAEFRVEAEAFGLPGGVSSISSALGSVSSSGGIRSGTLARRSPSVMKGP